MNIRWKIYRNFCDEGVSDLKSIKCSEFMNRGKSMVVLYVHGRGGSADEAEHYKALFQDGNVIGLDYNMVLQIIYNPMNR